MTKSVFRIRKIAVVDIRGHEEHRELLFQALGGTYALQYPYDGGSILMLRVFHGREAREGRDRSTHAARRRRSICRSYSLSWFQLAKMRLMIPWPYHPPG
jgi:hypothetical protein